MATVKSMYLKALQDEINQNVEKVNTQSQQNLGLKTSINRGLDVARTQALQAVRGETQLATANQPMQPVANYTPTGYETTPLTASTTSALTAAPTAVSGLTPAGTYVAGTATPAITPSIVGTGSGQLIASSTIPAGTSSAASLLGTLSSAMPIVASALYLLSQQPGDKGFEARKNIHDFGSPGKYGQEVMPQLLEQAGKDMKDPKLRDPRLHNAMRWFADPVGKLIDSIFGDPKKQESEVAKIRRDIAEGYGLSRIQAGNRNAQEEEE